MNLETKVLIKFVIKRGVLYAGKRLQTRIYTTFDKNMSRTLPSTITAMDDSILLS